MSEELKAFRRSDTEQARWLADKIHALGDYAAEAAHYLLKLADALESRPAPAVQVPEGAYEQAKVDLDRADRIISRMHRTLKHAQHYVAVAGERYKGWNGNHFDACKDVEAAIAEADDYLCNGTPIAKKPAPAPATVATEAVAQTGYGVFIDAVDKAVVQGGGVDGLYAELDDYLTNIGFSLDTNEESAVREIIGRALLASPAPVVDGWIQVSERLPEKAGHYLCRWGIPKPSGCGVHHQVHYFDGANFDIGDSEIQPDYWQGISPLPAPPAIAQQEPK